MAVIPCQVVKILKINNLNETGYGLFAEFLLLLRKLLSNTSSMNFFESIDTQFLLLVNQFHFEAMDTVMYTITNKWFWVPFYALILAYIFMKQRPVAALWCIVSIVVAITLSDQIGSGWLRHTIARLRPSNPENPISPLVHIVNDYRSGRYGFPSCHASNSFALAMLLWLYFRNRTVAWVMFPWAVLQCYSRAYLGVHYPGDLMAGAMLGCGCASVVYYVPRTIGQYLVTRGMLTGLLIRRGVFGKLSY